MATTRQKTFTLLPTHLKFLDRKKAELRRMVPAGQEDRVTDNTVLQGLFDFWMRQENAPEVSHKGNARKGTTE